MSATIDENSTADRPLYSWHKALDAVLDLGAIPQRLFQVAYPVWRVRVEGRQRVATDFEELEWFLERGLHEAGLNSVEALAHFFGLEVRFVRKLVGFLRGIGHIAGDDAHLALTELGTTSVQEKVRYQDQETSAYLYFDGLGSRPLTREHYAVPIYEDLDPIEGFRSFHVFDHHWDQGALQRLMALADRDQYNLPDEVTQVTLLDREPAYLPAYIVERQADRPVDLPLYLVFSRIRSLRDAVLEEAVNVEAVAQVPLRHRHRDNLEWAVEQYLGRRGLDRRDWYLQPNGPWGAQAMVDSQVLDLVGDSSWDDEGQTLSVRQVGGYFLTHSWCVWLTCDDAGIRRQAAIEQLLEWLQRVTATPTAEELRKRLHLMRERLRIEPISPDTLMDLAEQQGLARALE
ncbi:MAG: hypothetical protein JXM73_13730, partial [Anaerolineae bacterium]|nr:hypothetical protein [Anaerolineae bacterium]